MRNTHEPPRRDFTWERERARDIHIYIYIYGLSGSGIARVSEKRNTHVIMG